MKTGILLIAMSTVALGQSFTEPPFLFRIIRNVGGQRLYGQGRPTVPVFAAHSVTGLMESWVLEAHDSFGSIEDMDRMLSGQVNGPVLEPPRVMVAAFRPGLSYRAPDAAKAFAKARYFQISVFQVRPGGEKSFGDSVRARRIGADIMNLDRPDIAYEVISGAPSGTFFVLAPLNSLRTLDEFLARTRGHSDGAVDAKGQGAEPLISREHLLFRLDPRLSFVTDEFAAEDPEFWRGVPRK